jgi:hypothetical protein
MPSTYSTDLSLELITTGEKAGLWGTITNTNLEILQQASSGYVEVPMTSGTDVTLSLADGSSSANGKNIYLKLTGTMTASISLIIPAATTGGTARRTYIIEDATDRTTANNYTINIKTAGSATAVNGDQVVVDTQANAVTITLPITPNVTDEVTIMDGSATNGFATNNVTVDRNGSNINGAATNYTLNIDNQCVTFIYANATKGWLLKSTNQ